MANLESRLGKEYNEKLVQREAEITAQLTKEFKTWENQFAGDREKNQDSFQRDLSVQSTEYQSQKAGLEEKIRSLTEANKDLAQKLQVSQSEHKSTTANFKLEIENMTNAHFQVLEKAELRLNQEISQSTAALETLKLTDKIAMDDIEKNHQEQSTIVKSELSKEISTNTKKLEDLKRSHQEELQNIEFKINWENAEEASIDRQEAEEAFKNRERDIRKDLTDQFKALEDQYYSQRSKEQDTFQKDYADQKASFTLTEQTQTTTITNLRETLKASQSDLSNAH
jgi:hypothetical protein